jgi:2-hydroxycyclohexanecarboxyl-CoA dehydrogenase
MLPGRFEDGTQDYWDKIVETKLYGFIYTVFHALPQMKPAGWGKIVNIVGDSGRVGNSNCAVHSGVQGALITMTKSWAREFAPYHIRVNAVSLGPVDTASMPKYEAAAPTFFAGQELDSLLGRATPKDAAAAVSFFAGTQSDSITGEILSVSAGRSFAS